jgi:hypothetical protein
MEAEADALRNELPWVLRSSLKRSARTAVI